MRVLFLSYLPSPYRVEFFSELAKYCELTVVFERKSANHRNGKWVKDSFDGFKVVTLSKYSKWKKWNILMRTVSDNLYDEVVIHNASTPLGMATIQYMKLHRIKYWIETDGGFPKSGKGFKESIKKHIFSGAYGYLSSGKMNDKYLMTYGANENRIYHYPFTSLYDCDLIETPLSSTSKLDKRKSLGILEENVAISVGRFSYLAGYGKGYDVLLKAAKGIPNTGVYIIGDEPTDEFIKMKENMRINNVHYVGYKNKEELKEYYQSADYFVLMTVSDVWGLVINEAMSNALPIITTNMCGAGIDLVSDGDNGYLINVGDVRALRNSLNYLNENQQLRYNMAQRSLKRIKEYTHEKAVLAHLYAFENRRNT